MNPDPARDPKVKGRFKVGDHVRFKYIWPDADVLIVADRGPIGHKGRYFYHVRIRRPMLEDGYMDCPEDGLLPLDADE